MEMQWINMKDRKPENGQEVLYYFDICGVNYGKYSRVWEEDEQRFYDCFYGSKGFLCDDVTHWMPMPEPPSI